MCIIENKSNNKSELPFFLSFFSHIVYAQSLFRFQTECVLSFLLYREKCINILLSGIIEIRENHAK